MSEITRSLYAGGLNSFYDLTHRHKLNTITYPKLNYPVLVQSNLIWSRLRRGKWERQTLEYVRSIVRQGETILDLGAWVGMYVLLFSILVGDHGRVVAFEPDPQAFQVLQRNITANGFSNVVSERTALSNFKGETILFAHDSHLGNSASSILPKNQKESVGIHVPVTTLDDYCLANEIKPAGIKIDCEGSEALIFQGALKTIRKYKPWLLLEFHNKLMEYDERYRSWNYITKEAEQVIFIEGDDRKLKFGEKLQALPDSPIFRVYMKF